MYAISYFFLISYRNLQKKWSFLRLKNKHYTLN